MNKLDLDSFGAIVDRFLKDNVIHMMLTLPEGSVDVQVRDNTGLGSTVQFYILLNAIKPICNAMQKDMGIDCKSEEWQKTVDALLGIVKADILEGSNDE